LRRAKRDHPKFAKAEQFLEIALIARAILLEDENVAVAGKKSYAVFEGLLGLRLVQADFPLIADQGCRSLGQTGGNKRPKDIGPAERWIIAQQFLGYRGKTVALGWGNRNANLLDNRNRRAS
jgi:hypothetical protein